LNDLNVARGNQTGQVFGIMIASDVSLISIDINDLIWGEEDPQIIDVYLSGRYVFNY